MTLQALNLIHTSGQPPHSGASRFLLSAFFCCLLQRLPLERYFCCCMATVMIDCGAKSVAQLIITGGGWQPGRGWTLSGWHSRAGCGMMRPLGGAGHDSPSGAGSISPTLCYRDFGICWAQSPSQAEIDCCCARELDHRIQQQQTAAAEFGTSY
eukprot:COSAG01_NODE_2324_length_7907_cov_69.755763_4_plen_154_part_00